MAKQIKGVKLVTS